MSVCSVWCKLTCIDLFYLLFIGSFILSALSVTSGFNSRIGTGSGGQGQDFAGISYSFNTLGVIGVFNRLIYVKSLRANPERTGRVVNLIFFNLSAVGQIFALVSFLNIGFIATVLDGGATVTAIALNVLFLFFDKFYTRTYLKRYERALCPEKDRKALSLPHKRALAFNTLGSNFLPFNWIIYLATFIPLNCFI